jgi:outer membrane protein TolC
VQSQYRAGAVSGLELAEARQALASQLASQRQLQQQAVEAQTALALLFDGPPGTSTSNPQSLPDTALPSVRAGLPVDLLARRPDLRAAQLRLQGSFTNIDATRLSYYPSLTLTGSLGTSSASLLSLLSNPVAALGAGISLPFLRRTEMKLNIQVSEAEYEEAVVNYRQTLYVALGDVENSLSAQEQLAQQGLLLAQVLEDARRVERLYEIQYRAGAATLKAWLDAQERRRSAEIAVAENRLARLSNQVGLYQALGGGDAVGP